jgi:HK97 family phage prohead protease
LKDNGLWYRHFELDRATVNEQGRSVELSFSSETPVQRWFGAEILWHDAEAIDLSRIQAMGSVLMNHDPRTIVGRPDNIRVERKKGRATIIFDEDPDGDKAFSKVKSGSLRGVSVGYIVSKFKELQEGETWRGFDGPAYVATRWQPVEISLTPIPADSNVGVGRSLDGIEIEKSNTEGGHKMTEEQLRAVIEEERKRSTAEIKQMLDDFKQQQKPEETKPQLRIAPEEFGDLLGRASAISPDAVVKFSGWVAEGKSAPEIQRSLLEMATAKPDARDAGASSGDGTGLPAGKPDAPPTPTSWKDVDDDTFIRGLTNPSMAM